MQVLKPLKSTVLGAVLIALVSLTGCGASKLTPRDEGDLGLFAAAIAACNAQPDPLSCKKAVKAVFDEHEQAQFDGGFVAPDGAL